MPSLKPHGQMSEAFITALFLSVSGGVQDVYTYLYREMCIRDSLYSAPGRTEIGGNHTDHQHGRVLAVSVNIDMIAAAAPNDKNQLRVQSEGYDLCVIDLNDLEARKEEELSLIHIYPSSFLLFQSSLHCIFRQRGL